MRTLGRYHQLLSCQRMPNVPLDAHLMVILVLSCQLQVSAAECSEAVLANRISLFEPEGGSISRQCEVQDCGQKNWTGGWGVTVAGHFTYLSSSSRIKLSNYTVPGNRTRLFFTIHILNQSDSGWYQCQIQWSKGDSSHGHVTYLNVTTVEPMQRKLSHRLLVCATASLCFPLALGLARCLSSKQLPAPPVPPHFRGKSTARVKPKAEVVYAAVTLNSSRRDKQPQANEPTVYTSINFSTA